MHDSNWFERDPDELVKKWRLANGNAIMFIREYPTGMWFIRFEKGAAPPDLQGKYSSYLRAFNDVADKIKNRSRPNHFVTMEPVSREEAINASFRRNRS